MQVNEMTIEDFKAAILNENNVEHLQQICVAMALDLKVTKETMIKISEMFGLYENGKFSKDVKAKKVLPAIMDTVKDAMNPFSNVAEKWAFLKEIAVIATKYQNL
jgi:hypothetical protein